MGWSDLEEEELDTQTPGGVAQSGIHEFMSGESASFEVLRDDDSPSENWIIDILQSVDGVNVSDVPSPRRIFGFGFLRVILGQASVGTRFFAVRIQNAELVSPNDTVHATMRRTLDGISL